jgi:hypothetical protein
VDPKPGDLLIRTAPSRDDTSCFVLLDALSERLIVGPVATFEEVLRTAKDMTGDGVVIWQQFTDVRGRPTGPMMKLDLLSL